MELVALKTFRPQYKKGVLVSAGDTFIVDDPYGRDLMLLGLAAQPASKQLQEHENKMLKDYQDKGMLTVSESPEQRAQGYNGPVAASETPEERNQGKSIKGK